MIFGKYVSVARTEAIWAAFKRGWIGGFPKALETTKFRKCLLF